MDVKKKQYMDEFKIKWYEIMFVFCLAAGAMTIGISFSLIIAIEASIESTTITYELSKIQINELILGYALSNNPILNERANSLGETVDALTIVIQDYKNSQIETKRITFLILYSGVVIFLISLIPGVYLLRAILKKKKS